MVFEATPLQSHNQAIASSFIDLNVGLTLMLPKSNDTDAFQLFRRGGDVILMYVHHVVYRMYHCCISSTCDYCLCCMKV